MKKSNKSREKYKNSYHTDKLNRALKIIGHLLILAIILATIYFTSNKDKFVMITLILVGFIMSNFIVGMKKIEIEKSILMYIGMITIGFGMTGIFSYQNRDYSNYQDVITTVYQTFQLFVGEFETCSLENGIVRDIPIILNIARFLALFTTIGLVVLVTLRQKIRYFKMKFYKNHTIIITDKPKGPHLELAQNLKQAKEKIIFGYTDTDVVVNDRWQYNFPIVHININDNNNYGLIACHVKYAKAIYLLCDKTDDNVQLAQSLFDRIVANEIKIHIEHIQQKECGESYEEGLKILTEDLYKYLTEGLTLEDKEKKKFIQSTIENINEGSNDNKDESLIIILKDKMKGWRRNFKKAIQFILVKREVACYIHYNTDTERDYFSQREEFNCTEDRFDTRFINSYDIAARQLIYKDHILESMDKSEWKSEKEFINSLESINLAVTGSGEILTRTIYEILKNCHYYNKGNMHEKMKLYYLKFDFLPNYELPKELVSYIDLERLVITEENYNEINKFNRLYISNNEMCDIFLIIQYLFQNKLMKKFNQCMILANDNDREFELVYTYLKKREQYVELVEPRKIISKYRFITSSLKENKKERTKIYLYSVTKLLTTFDDFYSEVGACSKNINDRFNKKSINEGWKRQWKNLKELFRESTRLSVKLTGYRMNVLKTYASQVSNNINKSELERQLKKLITYVCRLEHQRWCTERKLQGYIYSEDRSEEFKRNQILMDYNDEKFKNYYKAQNDYYALYALFEFEYNRLENLLKSKSWSNYDHQN